MKIDYDLEWGGETRVVVVGRSGVTVGAAAVDETIVNAKVIIGVDGEVRARVYS